MVRYLSRSPITRASAQFYLASIARSSRHLFVIAAAAGLSVAIAAFVTITIVLPTIERAVFLEPTGMAWLIGVLTAIAVVLRISHRRRRVVPDEDLDEPADVQVLNLN